MSLKCYSSDFHLPFSLFFTRQVMMKCSLASSYPDLWLVRAESKHTLSTPCLPLKHLSDPSPLYPSNLTPNPDQRSPRNPRPSPALLLRERGAAAAQEGKSRGLWTSLLNKTLMNWGSVPPTVQEKFSHANGLKGRRPLSPNQIEPVCSFRLDESRRHRCRWRGAASSTGRGRAREERRGTASLWREEDQVHQLLNTHWIF